MLPSPAVQEVRLYAAVCLCHILRLNAPDTPYTDAELEVRGGMAATSCAAAPSARSVPGCQWPLPPCCLLLGADPACCCHGLQSIFELLNSVYGELDDPAAPHFQLCLSILETAAQVRGRRPHERPQRGAIAHGGCRKGCQHSMLAWHDQP